MRARTLRFAIMAALAACAIAAHAEPVSAGSSAAGYAVTERIALADGGWDFADLDTFIANPKAAVAGTKMAYAGEKDPNKRADIVAYLRSLSDNPAPLPQ